MKSKNLKNKKDSGYEVEVRSLVSSKNFESLLTKLNTLFGNPKIVEKRSFLFKSKDKYARIRIIKGKKEAVLTEKIGSYKDLARKEINKRFNLNKKDLILKNISKRGLNKCSFLESVTYFFRGPNNQELALSRHYGLGIFLEAEIIVKKEKDIKEAYDLVSKTLSELKLRKLNPDRYQKMMDDMYLEKAKTVASYLEKINYF